MAHDYIVVGAGSAGCALAAGLAAKPDTSVLLLEAGPTDRNLQVRVPAAMADLWLSELDWAYDTTPQPGLDGRGDTWPRGKLIGGPASINAMMYVRGLEPDFDAWADAGADGWDAAAMLAAFRRIEDDARGPAEHRGTGGPLHVQPQRDPSPLSLAFLDACAELGIEPTDDYHLDPYGASLAMVTQRPGRRWSAADAFLRPALKARGSQLTVRPDIEVTRIVVEDGRAVGVGAIVRGRRRVTRANSEVIVCAGAVASPTLLQRSGVGPADQLRRVGIDVAVDLPGVGENLADHLSVPSIAAVDGPHSLYGADTEHRHLLRWLTGRRGKLTSNIGEALAFLRPDGEQPGPDLELIFAPAGIREHGAVEVEQPAVTCGPILLQPASRGSVRLASSEHRIPPLVDPGSLSDPEGEDLRRLVHGARVAQQVLTTTEALGRHVTSLLLPERILDDDAQLAAHVRATAVTLYHPVGTCRIGRDDDPLAVVDPQLRVRGVDGLRVADASVLPSLIRGHTNAAAIAVGERAARIVTGVETVPVTR